MQFYEKVWGKNYVSANEYIAWHLFNNFELNWNSVLPNCMSLSKSLSFLAEWGSLSNFAENIVKWHGKTPFTLSHFLFWLPFFSILNNCFPKDTSLNCFCKAFSSAIHIRLGSVAQCLDHLPFMYLIIKKCLRECSCWQQK